MRHRNATDESLRSLERRVLAGDLGAVQALARAYDRVARDREVTFVVMHETDSLLAFEHAAGMTHASVVAAARAAIRDAVAAVLRSGGEVRPGLGWLDMIEDFVSQEDWGMHGLARIYGTTTVVDPAEDFSSGLTNAFVEAEVHTDDGENTAEFNAAPWLAQATVDEIVALAGIGWRGGYESDAVAEWTIPLDVDVRVVFRRIRRRKLAFECSVNEEQAMVWLAAHRPEAVAAIEADALQEAAVAARQPVADQAFENYDFEHPVTGIMGWETSGDVWERTVYLENPEGGDSIAVRFRVTFVPGAHEITEFGVV